MTPAGTYMLAFLLIMVFGGAIGGGTWALIEEGKHHVHRKCHD